MFKARYTRARYWLARFWQQTGPSAAPTKAAACQMAVAVYEGPAFATLGQVLAVAERGQVLAVASCED